VVRFAAFVAMGCLAWGLPASAQASSSPVIESESVSNLEPTPRTRASTQPHTLVAYQKEDGGIVFRHTSLVVSTHGQATVRFERCLQRFHLGASLWKKLKAALKQTNVHALAGNHAPATPRADESTWVITVGHDRVRIHGFAIPQELRVKLEPLLKILGEVVSVGERHIPQSCSSKRTVNGTPHIKPGAQPSSTGGGTPPPGTSTPPSGTPPPAGTDTTPPTFAGLQKTFTCSPEGEPWPYELTWKAATDDVTPSSQIVYDVFYATHPGGEDFSHPTWTTSPGVTSFKTPPLHEPSYFVVRARDQAGNEDQNTVERANEHPCV